MTITRRIVQTHRDDTFAKASSESWKLYHPDFRYHFYDDAACRAVIARGFPQLLATYDKLPLAVQKADMFRYAAIYEGGGIYADTDTRCCAPLHNYLDLDVEHLVVGLEMAPSTFSRGIDAYMVRYCLPHQLLQWTFAASSGHPALALVLQRIAYNVSQMDSRQIVDWSRSARFTLELTGPMLFSQVCNEFLSGTRNGRITVLPRLAWGAWPREHLQGQLQDQIKVRHLFEGSWKAAPSVTNQAAVAMRYQFKL